MSGVTFEHALSVRSVKAASYEISEEGERFQPLLIDVERLAVGHRHTVDRDDDVAAEIVVQQLELRAIAAQLEVAAYLRSLVAHRCNQATTAARSFSASVMGVLQ